MKMKRCDNCQKVVSNYIIWAELSVKIIDKTYDLCSPECVTEIGKILSQNSTPNSGRKTWDYTSVRLHNLRVRADDEV